jgi:coenzyme PQQ synthesis protein D (PqqD)
MRPRARTEDLLIEELAGELLVYDERHDTAACLNRTAAVVWQNATGERTVGDLVAVLAAEIGDLADEDLVLVTLDYLAEQGLLESGYERRNTAATTVSRRRFIHRAGVVGTATMALPVVQGIVAPTPAAASSPGPTGVSGPTGGLSGPTGGLTGS